MGTQDYQKRRRAIVAGFFVKSLLYFLFMSGVRMSLGWPAIATGAAGWVPAVMVAVWGVLLVRDLRKLHHEYAGKGGAS